VAYESAHRPFVSRWRLARSILLLPVPVTVLVPALLIADQGARLGWGLDGIATPVIVLAGVALIAAGLAVGVWTTRLFAEIGNGTLAPWDPPRRLVVEGPYRYVRNPMISGVIAILLGETVVLGLPSMLIWLAAVAATNQIYFVFVEEPRLLRRFGDEYRQYRHNVPRWIPRRSP
jgi:protein-S-isoprenylcysteine O-methyltransferase Ste14